MTVIDLLKYQFLGVEVEITKKFGRDDIRKYKGVVESIYSEYNKCYPDILWIDFVGGICVSIEPDTDIIIV